jgi:uncharacterized protein YfaP (DUF2135 family)
VKAILSGGKLPVDEGGYFPARKIMYRNSDAFRPRQLEINGQLRSNAVRRVNVETNVVGGNLQSELPDAGQFRKRPSPYAAGSNSRKDIAPAHG